MTQPCKQEARVISLEKDSQFIITRLDSIEKKFDNMDKKISELGNGGFRKVIMEINSKLMEEVLNRDDKERKHTTEKWKIISGVLGGGVLYNILNLFLKG